MYYVCKFSEAWSIYDVSKSTSRILTAEEISSLKSLCPSLLSDNTKVLTAIQILSINPNKLTLLTTPEVSKKDKKPELSTKT